MRSTKSPIELSGWLVEADVVIGQGHEPSTIPERATRVPKACPSAAIHLYLRCDDYVNLKFKLGSIAGSGVIQTESLAWCDLTRELSLRLDGIKSARKSQPLKVVVDLTDADWEVGFFVLPLLYSKAGLEVICTFTSPDTYPQAEDRNAHPPVDTHSIRQPPGWTAGLSGEEYAPRHVLFIGFDHDRAQKFIEHYNWDRSHCCAVIGDPPYVAAGVRESEKANELLLKQIPATTENRLKVAAANPTDTMVLLQALYAKHGALNIMLLGTSPMTLGAVWFYLQLSDEEKSHVRFLHDFPLRQTGRTSGVGQTWLFPRPSSWIQT
jgi:hypothetical protein